MLEQIISEILKEKENIHKEKNKNKKNNNNPLATSTDGNKRKDKIKFNKRKTHFPPKKYNLNFVNNVNSQRPKNKIKKKSAKGKSILSTHKKNKNNKQGKININQENVSSLPKINNKIKLSYNDYELNSLDYKQAILFDKRTCFEYYFSLIKRKNILIFSFFPINDFNSMIIKSSIFSLSFSIYYAVNFIFFTDNIMHKIYEEGGKYDIVFFLPKIAISFIAAYYLTTIIKLIFLSERNINNVRKQESLTISYSISDKEKKNMIIKYIIFFILGLIFLVFFWMLLSSFGAVYPNTQMFIFKNTLISFALSLLYPFFICIFPCLFRFCALNSEQKDSECMYKISKFLQIL